jgi:hypothetical protein
MNASDMANPSGFHRLQLPPVDYRPVIGAPQAAGGAGGTKHPTVARMARRTTVTAARRGGITMKNPLDSIWGTIISGLVLTAILYYVVKSMLM